MAQWGEDNMKISKTSPSSLTVTERGPRDNNLELVLSKGRII
ncbi:hypothetical protein scyTo_0022434, partial [Scyliorhinus torazame]|nr:hypothetical protein [Scyliorhinus torazame]